MYGGAMAEAFWKNVQLVGSAVIGVGVVDVSAGINILSPLGFLSDCVFYRILTDYFYLNCSTFKLYYS